MKKPFAKLAAILATLFFVLGLSAPGAVAMPAQVPPKISATNSPSVTIEGAGVVTLVSSDVQEYLVAVNSYVTFHEMWSVPAGGTVQVKYAGLKPGDPLIVSAANYDLATFTISALTPPAPQLIPVPAYTLVPASCVNGANVPGSLSVPNSGHATYSIAGASGAYTGYGVVSLQFIAQPGYVFQQGQVASLPINLGSLKDCTPPKPVDADKDGIPHGQDKCAATPTGEAVDANGCSASQLDSDGDKVPNSIDRCPNTPPMTSVDNKGCPVLKPATPIVPTADGYLLTIPSVEGVIYTNQDGVVLPAGRHDVITKVGIFSPKPDGTLTVIAKAADGYTLTGLAHYNWPFVFRMPGSGDNIETKKVEICHATGSATNPYVDITVSVASIVHESGHASHEKDVIPGFDYVQGGVAKTFAGLNYDVKGKVLLTAHCKAEVIPPVGDQPKEPGTPPVDQPPVAVPGPIVNKPAPEVPVVPIKAPEPKVPTAQPVVPVVPAVPAPSTPAPSSQTEKVAVPVTGTMTIANAETAAGDGNLNSWLALAAGLALIVIATGYQLVTRRR